jgi:hypothetical protein
MAATVAILDLVSIDFLTNAWVDWSDFLVAHWGRLEEGSFRWPLIQDYLTNACRLVRFFGASLGVINLHHVPLLPKPYRPCTHRQRPNRGICHALRCPCLRLFSVNSCPSINPLVLVGCYPSLYHHASNAKSRYLIGFSYEKSTGRRYRQCFILDKSCRKMYTIFSAVLRQQRRSDVMT